MSNFNRDRPPRMTVELDPSTATPITRATSGWQAWAQVELYYQAWGQGGNVRLERTAAPTASAVDVAFSQSDVDPNKKTLIAEIEGWKPDEYDTRKVLDGWARAFWDFERADNPPPARGGDEEDE